jgi:predicted RNA-binding Zn-ribbon protein involved in translation (DUF1610 family)
MPLRGAASEWPLRPKTKNERRGAALRFQERICSPSPCCLGGMALKAEDLLLKCPKCGEWPMVANERTSLFSRKRVIQFVCIHCGHREINPEPVSPPK